MQLSPRRKYTDVWKACGKPYAGSPRGGARIVRVGDSGVVLANLMQLKSSLLPQTSGFRTECAHNCTRAVGFWTGDGDDDRTPSRSKASRAARGRLPRAARAVRIRAQRRARYRRRIARR